MGKFERNTENPEKDLEQGRFALEQNAQDLQANLDELEAANPSRADKVRAWLMEKSPYAVGGIVALAGIMRTETIGGALVSVLALGPAAGMLFKSSKFYENLTHKSGK